MKKLIGCIDTLEAVIKTRFFYVNSQTAEVRDVTLELCEAIESFNTVARKIRASAKGAYSMIIPYEYKGGLAEYSFGCGLSHYLQESELKEVVERTEKDGKKLSFPLSECTISMFTPDDVDNILECTNVFDYRINDALKARFVKEAKI